MKWLTRLSLITILALGLAPYSALAAGLYNRSDTLGNSAGGATTTHTITATVATTATVGSITFEFCTTATNACVTPTGITTTSTTLTAQTGATGFSINNSVNGVPYITRSATNLPAATVINFTLAGISNPSANNQSFYVRMTTYTGVDGATGAVDTGTMALSTAQPIQLTGVTPEILIFCVGTTITTDCSTISGNSIDFGDFDPLSTKSATSVMQATTNASNGYAITVNGTTLASGANTIPALGAQSTSSAGASQFGLNLRANTAPAIGANVTGPGTGAPTGNFATTNQYRFNTGDAVASANLPTLANTFTTSYIVNIGGNQAAGVYTSTMTYICTASF